MPRGPKFPLMALQSPGKSLGDFLTDRLHFRPSHLLVGEVVNHAHEAESANSNVDHSEYLQVSGQQATDSKR